MATRRQLFVSMLGTCCSESRPGLAVVRREVVLKEFSLSSDAAKVHAENRPFI
jgi:hypothetical protein